MWVHFFYTLSALGIFAVAKFLPQQDIRISPIYVTFIFVYVLLSFIFRHRFERRILSKWVFFGAMIPFLVTEPLLENDHYRYLWEGKVISHFENPYIKPPNDKSLTEIPFAAHEKIGFPHLTTVYPPLGLAWFTFVSPFPYKIALSLMMMMNALLLFILIKWISEKNYEPWLLVASFPLLQKEFVQSVHIDIVAFFFFFLGLRSKSFWGILASFWTKFLGGIGFLELPKKQWPWFFIGVLALPIFLFALGVRPQTSSGAEAFSTYWMWNPGFTGFLWKYLQVQVELARNISMSIFVVIGCLLILRRQKIEKDQFYLLFFSTLLFFSPVFNPWYTIWFLPFALSKNNFLGVLYAFASCLGYLNFDYEGVSHYTIFFTHIFYLLMIIGLLRSHKIS